MKPEFKKILHDYRHFWILSYELLYLAWFTWLQYRTIRVPYYVLHDPLDDKIPFVLWFVIPYFMWFAYVFLTKVLFFFKSPELFVRHNIFLYAGMNFCLIVYTLFPNGQDLRPIIPTTGLFSWAMNTLWAGDPPVNVCPSIHVYNSIGTAIALWRYQPLKKYPILYYGSPVLAVLITLSTAFLKQHSVLDVYCAIALAVPFYFLIFRRESPLLKKLYD